MIRGILALMLAATALPATAQTVRTDAGPIRGKTEKGRSVFRGIPFAAPPLGERRWAPPVPSQPWRQVRAATAPAPACSQADFGWNHHDFVFQSEDCLTLDVSTQALTGKRPVLVWIHGGSNIAGSPGDMTGSPIVDKGIVLVGVRYRLGALGFLMHRGFPGSGNLGLLDQGAALRWVRDNIARFGGDPDQVTIAGESAGAQDVGLLLAIPAARGLFRRAMLGSGTPQFGLPTRSREQALRIGDQLDTLLGTGGDIAKLRTASAAAIVAAGQQLHDQTLTDDDYRWLRATIDGEVLPAEPRTLIAAAPPHDVLIGTNRFELDLPGGPTRRDAFVALSYGAQEDAARAFYRLDRPDPVADSRRGTRDQQIATDATFRCPAQRLATLLAGRGGHVWSYMFDGAPGGGMTRHAIELPYIYGDQRLGSLRLMDYWANFVKTGDPNADGLPRWPRLDAAGTLLALDAGGAVPMAADPRPCNLTEPL